MSRESVLARYANLDAQIAAAEHSDPRAPMVLAPVDGVEPSLVHRQVVELLDELLGLVPADGGPVGMLLKTLRRAEPMLLRDFAKVPPEPLVEFLHSLGDRFHAIGADGSQPAQSQSA